MAEGDEYKVVAFVACWVQAFLYGAYFLLFVIALKILLRNVGKRGSTPKVLLVGIVSMFIFITLTVVTNFYRLIEAYVYQRINLRSWDGFLGIVMQASIFWIGDALMIWRCFLVWGRRYRIIAFPMLVFAASIVTHLVNMTRVAQLNVTDPELVKIWPFWSTTLAVYLAQNILTSGLIIFKLWSQRRRARAARLISLFSPSLHAAMCMVIESAAIFTGLMAVALFLRVIEHPARYLIYMIQIPVTGIVFVLLVVRAHGVREEAREMPISVSLVPSWIWCEAEPIHAGPRVE